MSPEQTASAYDAIATWWQEQHRSSDYGISALNRAIEYCANRGTYLDVGCGSSGRFMREAQKRGFSVSGLDVSPEMVRLTREILPQSLVYCADISQWEPTEKYDLITAWDSTFHLPLERQEPALYNMLKALQPNGVLLFTCGGGDGADTATGGFQGQSFSYSTLGVRNFIGLLHNHELQCLHVEYDQGLENRHVVIIARQR